MRTVLEQRAPIRGCRRADFARAKRIGRVDDRRADPRRDCTQRLVDVRVHCLHPGPRDCRRHAEIEIEPVAHHHFARIERATVWAAEHDHHALAGGRELVQRRLETDLFGSPTSDSPADPAEPSAAKSSSSDAPAPAAADDDARVDAILDKIARLGLSSLTDSERASLHQATQRKRNPAE